MPHILIVEDDLDFRNMLAAVLKQEGHTVEEAGDGRTAGRWLSTHKFDLVLTDVHMPEADGLEMIMKLHDARNPTPIIAMTGGHLQSDLYLKVAKTLGARRVLEKPFKLSALFEAIRDVLDEAQPKT
jgi:two-component system, OmpR family, response regulator